MVCPAGVYLVNLIDNVMSGYPVLIICLMELIVISYIYGEFLSIRCTCAVLLGV